MKPEVGDWIAYRDWGMTSIGEVRAIYPGHIEVRNGYDLTHVAYGSGSVVEIRKPAPTKKPKAKKGTK